ncbi:Zinc finger domain containing protein [Entamoeba marina]
MEVVKPLDGINSQLNNQSLTIKSIVQRHNKIVCLTTTNAVLLHDSSENTTTLHLPPPLIRSPQIISIDICDDVLLTVSSDNTVLVIDLVSYRVFYRQIIANATIAQFLSKRVFTLYSSDKTLRVIEYPDSSILGFGQRGRVDVLSTSCVSNITTQCKQIGEFLLATEKSVFLWLRHLNAEKLNKPDGIFAKSIPPFTCPPTEYYLYTRIISLQSRPVFNFQVADEYPGIAVYTGGVLNLFNQSFVDGVFTVNNVLQITTEQPTSVFCTDKGAAIDQLCSGTDSLTMVSLGSLATITMPTEEDFAEEVGDVDEQLEIYINGKASQKLREKGIKLVCQLATTRDDCWKYAQQLDCIDQMIKVTPQEKKTTYWNYLSESLQQGNAISLEKETIWQFFVFSLSQKTSLSDNIIAYYSNYLDTPSVISICIEYSRYQTIFTMYHSLGNKTIDAFSIVTRHLLTHGISPTTLTDSKQQQHIKMLLTAAERCIAEGDEEQITQVLFRKSGGMTLYEAGIIVSQTQTLDIIGEISQKHLIVEGLAESLNCSITEIKEITAREIVKMKLNRRGMISAVFIVLTSKDYSKDDALMCVKAVKECVSERSGHEIEELAKAAFAVKNKALLRILVECETAREALLTLLIIQKGDVWGEIETFLRCGISKENVEKSVKKLIKKMYKTDIAKTFDLSVKYFPSCALFCLVQTSTPDELIYKFGRDIISNESPLIQTNMKIVVLKFVESCYHLNVDTSEIHQLLKNVPCDYEKIIELALQYNDERTVVMLRKKLGLYDECLKSIRIRINEYLKWLKDIPKQEDVNVINEQDENEDKQIITSKENDDSKENDMDIVNENEKINSGEENVDSKEKDNEIISEDEKTIIDDETKQNVEDKIIKNYDNNYLVIVLEDLVNIIYDVEWKVPLVDSNVIVLIMKNVTECFNLLNYSDKIVEMVRKVMVVIAQDTQHQKVIDFALLTTNGLLLRYIMQDIYNRSQVDISMLKAIQQISNEQLTESRKQQFCTLKQGITITNQCCICNSEKKEAVIIFGCKHVSPLIIQHPRPAQPRLQSIKTLLKDSDNNNNDTFQPFDSSRNKNISTKIFDKRLGETAWKETITYNPGNKTSPTIQKDNLPLMSSALSWNERFQEILCKEECLEKFEELVSFYNDFLRTAEMYGKIIISEMFLPTEEKTIKPITTSNSNSERYIVRGIFLKSLCCQSSWSSIKRFTRFYNARISGLHLPLAALIDFQGYRLFAISVLPIRSTTLCYGSRDGNTVIISNLEVSEKMEQAAKILNIKGHSIQNKLIYGPADVEVYEGLDGRYYLCDCARLFPCEAPPQDFKKRNYFDKSSYLYRLLRPEFIQMYYKPLSSDAFSPFDKYDPNKEVNRREIIEATKYLLEHVIPDFVQEIEQEQIYKKHDFRLTRDLHQAGINVRHLLNIWGITTKPLFAKIVITECVARAVKRKIKAMQRTQLRANPDVPLIGEFKEVLLNFFNILIAPMSNNQTKELWEQTIPKIIEKMFPIYIHSIEIPIGCNLRDSVDLNYFFTAISKLTGIYFSDEAVQEVVEDPHHFSFVDPDIVKN